MPHTRSLIRLVLIAGLFAPAAMAENVPGPISLFLPPVIHATPGIECNLYFDNVVLTINSRNFAFDVTCGKGAHQADRWTYTPAAEDAGDYALTLDVRNDENTVIAHAETVVRVVSPSGTGEPVSALLIGDSLTHASVYAGHLLDLHVSSDTPALTLVGSHVPDRAGEGVRHEGYGGWTAARFATHYTGTAREGGYKDRGSPFLYEDEAGERALDYGRYCEEVNGGKRPDVVTIFLGCNDVFSATDETIDDRMATMFTHMDALIAAIQKDYPATQIGLIAPVPAAVSQDAFGHNYRSGQTQWQYKRNQHKTLVTMYERYGRKEAEGLSLIPAFVNLDCAHNYPESSAPWNARTEKVGIRQSNSVHPNADGYKQIGDSIFAWMQSK